MLVWNQYLISSPKKFNFEIPEVFPPLKSEHADTFIKVKRADVWLQDFVARVLELQCICNITFLNSKFFFTQINRAPRVSDKVCYTSIELRAGFLFLCQFFSKIHWAQITLADSLSWKDFPRGQWALCIVTVIIWGPAILCCFTTPRLEVCQDQFSPLKFLNWNEV